MTKKTKEETIRPWFPSKRKRNNAIVAPRDLPDVVPQRASHLGEVLARQQAQGVEQCTSRTIPVQHDAAFGEPDVLGKVCQDGHLLMQQMLDAQIQSSASDDKVS